MFPKIKHRKKYGFTLIEILITVSLVSMIALAIYKSLSSGINVWKRNSQYIAEEDVSIFFDKINRDLNNTFYFSGISFSGSSTLFSFPTIVNTLKDHQTSKDNDVYWDQVGKVEYYFDSEKKQLLRRQANYSQAVKDVYGETRVIANSLKRVQFHYYYLTEDGEAFSDSALNSLPLGLEVEVAIEDPHGKRVISKFFNIPMGG